MQSLWDVKPTNVLKVGKDININFQGELGIHNKIPVI